jgi:hypothetical protein
MSSEQQLEMLVKAFMKKGLVRWRQMRDYRWYEPLFSSIKTHSKEGLGHTLVFLVRRIMLFYAVAYGQHGWLQVQIFILSSMINLISLLHLQPFLTYEQNRMELANEVNVWVICATCLSLSGQVSDADGLKRAGSLLFYAVMTQVCFNLGVIIIDAIVSKKKQLAISMAKRR